MEDFLVVFWEQNGVPFRDAATPDCSVADVRLTGQRRCCSSQNQGPQQWNSGFLHLYVTASNRAPLHDVNGV
jgi:hypothetical protein